jgi:hypothetical protein
MTEHIERDGPGRRDYDKYKCPNCDILWDNLKAERLATKEHICTKIGEVRKDVGEFGTSFKEHVKAHDGFVPRWMFVSGVVVLLAVGGWWFQSFSTAIKESQKEVKESLQVIHRRVSETDNNREALKDSLVELKWSVNGLSNRVAEVEKQLKK